MKRQKQNHGIIEYTELCNTIRKRMHEEKSQHKCHKFFNGERLLSRSLNELQEMINELQKERDEELQIVDEVVYLGQQITMNRISAAWIAFARYRNILKSNIPICLKRKLYHQCIEPVITCGF